MYITGSNKMRRRGEERRETTRTCVYVEEERKTGCGSGQDKTISRSEKELLKAADPTVSELLRRVVRRKASPPRFTI